MVLLIGRPECALRVDPLWARPILRWKLRAAVRLKRPVQNDSSRSGQCRDWCPERL
jgi:hypothetical protein